MKKWTALLLACLFLASCTSQSDSLQRYSETYFDLFDTVTTLVAYGDSEEAFQQDAQAIYQALRYYHQFYDIYNDYQGINNLKTLNDQAALAPVTVEQPVIDLLLVAKEAYQLTEGKVNVAFGSVTSLWHDYREAGLADPDSAELPPMEALESAALHCDLDDVIIDETASTVYFADPLLQLDVGSIAKGYAAQQVAEEMVAQGVDNLLLGVGGNLYAIGSRDGQGELWPVGVEDPFADDGSYLEILGISDQALVTSGSYQRYYTVDGTDYHHIIDPDTLMPADYFVLVTLLTQDAGQADYLSTALFSMSYEDGLALVESLEGVEALWIDQQGQQFCTDGFAQAVEG